MSLRRIDITECHQILLQIATCFDQICRRHQIPYYMLGGTMLGAIRHQGFIPWDDDMDFGIPRPHFDRFIRIAEKELPEKYMVLTRKNAPAIQKGFIKIHLKGSKLIEKVFEAADTRFYNGIAIDVFPLDGCDMEGFRNQWRLRQLFLLIRMQEGRFCSLSIRTGVKKAAAALIKALPISDERLALRIERLLQSWDYDSSSFLSNAYGHWKEREIIRREIFGTPHPYSFGPLTLLGPTDYDAYLRSLYGSYMELPPQEQQITHADEMYVEE
ncbi:MAG: phosphorylcholine transferase LicD [Parabacteroides sp.]